MRLVLVVIVATLPGSQAFAEWVPLAFRPAIHSETMAGRTSDTGEAAIQLVQSDLDDRVLVKAIQMELNRLGCDAGAPDGRWGPASDRALDTYAAKTGQTGLATEPSADLLDRLRSERGRLCTLPPGIVAGDDRAATAHLEAVRYSYKVWTTLPSRVATESTDYGVLRCEAGRGNAPRTCNWQ